MTAPADPAAVTLPPGVESQVEETLPWKRILGLAAGALVLFFIGAVFAVLMFRDVHGQANELDQRPGLAVGQANIGIVSQRSMELETAAREREDKELKRLSSWGWADKAKGEVNIPIDVAIDRYLESKK